MRKKILFIGSIILLLMFSFFNSHFYLDNKEWKYSRGVNIGDYILYENFHKENFYICFGQYLIIIKDYDIGFYSKK
ncbi:hypothetical protein EB1_00040 [Empedobacter brevis NBRC 14943 = ATCC 43319]|uniref:Uncharacterized protein n=1 Tax=Empedobacter brevis NBRC 14943 = ATCC 43319 TaxID=1218108 RepID=A0A511NBK6_9FLAO|nr:hypothetical protein EB1_00040 [Empedobacter brevis NBRC 14943 = ATCC 43319]